MATFQAPEGEGVEKTHVRSGLEEYERSHDERPPWLLTMTELKLLGIAGVGFFLDGASPFTLNFIRMSLTLAVQRTISSSSM